MPSPAHRVSVRRAVSVTTHKKSVAALYYEVNHTYDGLDHLLRLGTSTDGVNFTLRGRPVSIENKKGTPEKLEYCTKFKISHIKGEYILSYVRNHHILVEAHSKDLTHFIIKSQSKTIHPKNIVEYHKKFVSFYGDHSIFTSLSTDADIWKDTGAMVLSPRKGFFDQGSLHVVGTHSLLSGVLVTYASHGKILTLGAALFSHHDPHKLIWRSDLPLWEKEFPNIEKWEIVGTIYFDGGMILYISSLTEELVAIHLPRTIRGVDNHVPLSRSPHNPIIQPHHENSWENEAVFNPAAFEDKGKVHLLYRAIGHGGISCFGYASSTDGLKFTRESAKPVFYPTGIKKAKTKYDPKIYPSGGSSHGAEDPRAVKIDDRIYVSYLAFGGWDFMRMALTSISLEDFRDKEWNWETPILLSPAGEIHKNWVLFPEKIKGKYAILHSISPVIKVDYVEDLEKTKIQSQAPQGGRKNFWDNKIRGAGPPPIKTNHGWLVLYHATDAVDPSRYKLGAMLLDLKDPTKILRRSSQPILSPDMYYENDGKPGVVYASGTVVKGDTLYVYYGGADKVVCVATIGIEELINSLS